MSGFFSDVTTLTLIKSLDGVATRHKVIADNIANVETPGFTRSDVSFDNQLKDALKAPGERILESRLNTIEPDITPDTTSPARPDGNNVSIDREMADLTKNSLRYEALVQLINLKASMIKTAVTEGRR